MVCLLLSALAVEYGQFYNFGACGKRRVEGFNVLRNFGNIMFLEIIEFVMPFIIRIGSRVWASGGNKWLVLSPYNMVMVLPHRYVRAFLFFGSHDILLLS